MAVVRRPRRDAGVVRLLRWVSVGRCATRCVAAHYEVGCFSISLFLGGGAVHCVLAPLPLFFAPPVDMYSSIPLMKCVGPCMVLPLPCDCLSPLPDHRHHKNMGC